MKRLNFFPFYEDYLRSRQKTTTFRLENHESFKAGDDIIISIGWEKERYTDLCVGKIRNIYRKRIQDLSEYDFEGESPDCNSPAAVKLVLSCIYRTNLTENNEIWVIKFDYKLE
jgi:uncharacterized protein YqfB (UPF0267 family)